MLFFMKSLSASDLVDLSYSDIVAKLNNLPENIIKNEQETISVFLENNAIDFEFTVNNNKYKLCQKYDRLDNVFDVFLVKKNNRNLNAEDYFNTSFIIKYDQKNDFFILAFYHPKMKLNVTSKLYSKEFKQDKIKDENYYDGFPSIIDFYESKLSDYRGRLIDDILAKNDDREFLEEEHDYIQWLFPKKSVGHALAYLWNQDVTKENINNSKFKNKLRESFKMMLNFYHLKFVSFD